MPNGLRKQKFKERKPEKSLKGRDVHDQYRNRFLEEFNTFRAKSNINYDLIDWSRRKALGYWTRTALQVREELLGKELLVRKPAWLLGTSGRLLWTNKRHRKRQVQLPCRPKVVAAYWIKVIFCSLFGLRQLFHRPSVIFIVWFVDELCNRSSPCTQCMFIRLIIYLWPYAYLFPKTRKKLFWYAFEL